MNRCNLTILGVGNHWISSMGHDLISALQTYSICIAAKRSHFLNVKIEFKNSQDHQFKITI